MSQQRDGSLEDGVARGVAGRLAVSGLEGALVRLRPPDLADAEHGRRWIGDPEVMRLLGGAAYQFSLPAEQEFLRSKLTADWEHGVFLAIETLDERRHIGNIELRSLHAESRRGEIGVVIGERDFWSRGYGEDAMRLICRFGFEDLDLHRIELTVGAGNPRARRCYEKVGFRAEGAKREHRYIAGRYHDTLIMGLLRREFEAREADREAVR